MKNMKKTLLSLLAGFLSVTLPSVVLAATKITLPSPGDCNRYAYQVLDKNGNTLEAGWIHPLQTNKQPCPFQCGQCFTSLKTLTLQPSQQLQIGEVTQQNPDKPLPLCLITVGSDDHPPTVAEQYTSTPCQLSGSGESYNLNYMKRP